MTAHQAVHRIATMARVLGVSPSGYYAWRKRPLSPRARTDVELTAQIEVAHGESRRTYGAPRIHADLAAHGIHVGCKRVARLMRGAGLQGVSRRKSCRTTVRDETARPALDLVDRQFTAAGPDRLWDGLPSPDRAGCRGVGHGARAAPAEGRHSSFGPWLPVHLFRLRLSVS